MCGVCENMFLECPSSEGKAIVEFGLRVCVIVLREAQMDGDSSEGLAVISNGEPGLGILAKAEDVLRM